MSHVQYHYKGRAIILSRLARKLRGVEGGSHTNLTRIWAGRHNPSWALAQTLADVMGLTMAEFADMLKFCRSLNAKDKAKKREGW